MTEIQSLFIIITAVGLVITLVGWKLDKTLEKLIKATERKTSFPYVYLEHASNEKSYETESNANYWLLLAVISLLSSEEF